MPQTMLDLQNAILATGLLHDLTWETTVQSYAYFKVAVITSSVAKITFVVVEITLKVDVIPSSVANITFVVAEITFESGCKHFVSCQDRFCSC